MSITDEPSEPAHLSVQEMEDWLRQELKDLDKARELRTKEATVIAEAYAKGELAPEEASKRLMNYEDRWGEALPGTHAMSHMTDEAIIAKIDNTRASLDAKAEGYHRRMARYAYRDLPSENER